MFLKLKQSIRAKGEQHRPPAVIDTEKLGISNEEANVLVRSGVAEIHDPKAEPAQAAVADPKAPEVIKVDEPKPNKAPKAKAKTDKE